MVAIVNSLEKRVEGLEKQLEAIKAMLEANNTNATVNTELNITKFEGEKVARSYKVNIEVQKQFKAFCKAHSEYEVGDILANAMLEFMNKYKKVLCRSAFFYYIPSIEYQLVE